MTTLQLTAAIAVAGLTLSGAAFAASAEAHAPAVATAAATRPTAGAQPMTRAGHRGRIAFTRAVLTGKRSWTYSVYVMNVDGSHLRRLAEGQDPSWSSDGRRIAFTGSRWDGIYVMNAAGGQATRLAIEPWYGIWPQGLAWSPDGRKIAVSRCQILVMDADGSNHQQLTQGSCSEEAPDRQPAWSPDGRWIVFNRENDFHDTGLMDSDGLYLVDASGGEPRPLTWARSFIRDDWPAWSPDGSRIAFHEYAFEYGKKDVNRVYVTGVDGHNLQLLGGGTTPAWSPNGRRIVFSKSGDLFVMSANGRHVRRLTSGPANDYSPAWFGRAPTRTGVNASPEPLAKGAPLTVAGQIAKVGVPLPDAAVTIRFKAAGAHRYATVAKLRTGSAGRYSLTVTAHRTGVWKAVHPASAATLASGATDRVTVRRR